MRYLTPEIFEGRDGWLFLAGGTNQILAFFSRDGDSLDLVLTSWSDLLRARQAKAGQFGSRYFHVIVPDKLNTYREEAQLGEIALRFPAEQLEQRAAEFGVAGEAAVSDVLANRYAFHDPGLLLGLSNDLRVPEDRPAIRLDLSTIRKN